MPDIAIFSVVTNKNEGKGTGQVDPVRCIEGLMGSAGVAALILSLGTRWR